MRHILPMSLFEYSRGPEMARAEAASASVRSDSIKGLAQSIAKPAYRRLLTAAPALRRAVPSLVIAFLLTICVGAFVQIVDHRRQVIIETLKAIEAGADVVAERIDHARSQNQQFDARLASEIDRMIPLWVRSPGRQILVTNPEGIVVAGVRDVQIGSGKGGGVVATPLGPATIGRRLLDVLGPAQPLTTFGAAAGVLEITLSDGEEAF